MTIQPEPTPDATQEPAISPEPPPLSSPQPVSPPTFPEGVPNSRDLAIRSARGWMLWIAGLSLVNVALAISGSEQSFAIGLFVSQFIAVVGHIIADEAHVRAIALSAATVAALPALGFLALWYGARVERRWVFTLAMIAYGIDLALLVAFLGVTQEMDVLGLGIHAWALWALYRGYRMTRAT